MCTISVKIDNNVIKGVRPDLDSTAAIRNWVQKLVDARIKEMLDEDEETMDIEEARAMVLQTVREEYARP